MGPSAARARHILHRGKRDRAPRIERLPIGQLIAHGQKIVVKPRNADGLRPGDVDSCPEKKLPWGSKSTLAKRSCLQASKNTWSGSSSTWPGSSSISRGRCIERDSCLDITALRRALSASDSPSRRAFVGGRERYSHSSRPAYLWMHRGACRMTAEATIEQRGPRVGGRVVSPGPVPIAPSATRQLPPAMPAKATGVEWQPSPIDGGHDMQDAQYSHERSR
ncbi:hypothetical protein ENSA7_20740 [Enhygromyxa salina]|uniref:Uncharacterized protein n=1 Tax=Enhygromyxa salina TaxID=215803 RepID=A0A2S9YST9_9BACT|nr:hypothetical protein ENSA7_20740 [Enhygromyxa salina]